MPIIAKQPIISNGSGGITENQHRSIDQLVHAIAEDSYYEIEYNGTYTWRVDKEIWYTDSGKTTKIREIIYSYTSIWKYSAIVLKQYDGTGTLEETLTGTVVYSDIFIDNITWVLT